MKKSKNVVLLYTIRLNVMNISLRQALNHELILKNLHRVIKFNQKAWVKPYIDMNTKLRQKAKNNF